MNFPCFFLLLADFKPDLIEVDEFPSLILAMAGRLLGLDIFLFFLLEFIFFIEVQVFEFQIVLKIGHLFLEVVPLGLALAFDFFFVGFVPGSGTFFLLFSILILLPVY